MVSCVASDYVTLVPGFTVAGMGHSSTQLLKDIGFSSKQPSADPTWLRCVLVVAVDDTGDLLMRTTGDQVLPRGPLRLSRDPPGIQGEPCPLVTL